MFIPFSRDKVCRSYFALLVFSALLCVLVPFPVSATSKINIVSVADQLATHYQLVGTHFWRGEDALSAQVHSLPQRKELFGSPVLESSAIGLEYSRAASAADAYLKLIEQHAISSWMTDHVIYLGGISHYTLGNYERAAQLFAALNPAYERDLYINDRNAPRPKFATPARPGISKLLFYSRLKSLPENPKDAFAALKQVTDEALSTLHAQREYAHTLANKPSIHDRRVFSEARFGSQPDQRRAGALPPTLFLVEEAWDKLLPAAAAGNGSAQLRNFLRGLAAPNGLLHAIASRKLDEFDGILVAQLKSDALAAEKAQQWARAKQRYLQLTTEFPGGEAEIWAQQRLTALQTRLARSYLDQAAPLMKLPGQKYAQAKPLYEKALAEAPDNTEAMLGLAQTLKGLGQKDAALKVLDKLAQRPDGDVAVAQALHEKAMTMLWFKEKPQQNLQLFQRVAAMANYEKAHEALYFAMYMQWKLGRQEEALKTLQEFLRKYPNSPYHEPAKVDLQLLQKQITEKK